jgi:hypothetical protein
MFLWSLASRRPSDAALNDVYISEGFFQTSEKNIGIHPLHATLSQKIAGHIDFKSRFLRTRSSKLSINSQSNHSNVQSHFHDARTAIEGRRGTYGSLSKD